MKIALIGRYGESEIVTGPERFARELFLELKKRNNQVVFIEYFFSGYKDSSIFKKLFGKEDAYKNTIIRLGIIPFLLTVHSSKFEIIHIVNGQRFILFLLLLNQFIKGRIVTTPHGFLRNEIPVKNIWTKRYFIDLWVEKLLIKKSSLLIFPSNMLFDIFKKHYEINNKCQIIPNGVSNIFYSTDSSFLKIENSIKIVFYNGFDNSINRGLNELLFLLKNVKHRIKLFVIGDSTKQSSFNNIELNFVSLMSNDDLKKFLQDKHFIIKSTSFDTFSIFVAECMTAGLIPIVNENIGIKSFIEDKVNGFIYSRNSGEELPDLINDLFKNKYDLESISNNAKKIYERLNWQNIGEEYISAYKKVL